jgi:potassium channel subfamily K
MWLRAAFFFGLGSSKADAGTHGLILRGKSDVSLDTALDSITDWIQTQSALDPSVRMVPLPMLLQQPGRAGEPLLNAPPEEPATAPAEPAEPIEHQHGDGWAEEVVAHPLNEQAQGVSGENVGFKDEEQVYAGTCVVLILLIFSVVIGTWYFIPWDQEYYGIIKSGNVKIALLLLSWAGCGAVMMMAVEGYKPSTAFYVMAQIVSTVGYGDFTPTTWYAQLFMSFYCVLCMLVVAGLISSIAEQAVRRMERELNSKLAGQNKDEGNEGSSCGGRLNEASSFSKWFKKYGDLAVATFLFWFMVALGTFYFGYLEGCTCSYGVSRIQGCIDHPQETCRATGGQDLTYVQAFYMSCITLTTVGFGDFTPMSQHGRIFATFWMTIGIAATGNFIRAFSVVFMSGQQDLERVDVEDCFHRIDVNGDGHLDRYEFVSFCLLEHGLLTKEQFDSINKQYEALDVNGDEKVTLQMIQDRGKGGKHVHVEFQGQQRTAPNAILGARGPTGGSPTLWKEP